MNDVPKASLWEMMYSGMRFYGFKNYNREVFNP
jgi:hypothetical protein